MSDAPGLAQLQLYCGRWSLWRTVEEIGGTYYPGFGFALGLERLILTFKKLMKGNWDT